MYAVEFETVMHNQVIQVPEVCRGFEHKRIRVILLDTMDGQPIATLPDGFYHPLKVSSYHLAAREEIYVR